MQEYYFLFILAFIWTLFAIIQDFKKKEVANWLSFSLIAFALAYRLFYSISTKNYNFFLFGLFGFIIFVALAYALYYSKAFAGGDAKLLMGYGIIIPFATYANLISFSLAFLLLLFTAGAIYSLIYSVFIVTKNQSKFQKEFFKLFKKNKNILIASLVILVITILLSITFWTDSPAFWSLMLIILVFPYIWIYAKSLDKCMIFLVRPSKLTEGDWLEKDVKLRGKTIKKTVHGLSLEEIRLLRKHKKKVLIKYGIPFTPAFLISLILMTLWFLKFPEFSFFLFNFLN